MAASSSSASMWPCCEKISSNSASRSPVTRCPRSRRNRRNCSFSRTLAIGFLRSIYVLRFCLKTRIILDCNGPVCQQGILWNRDERRDPAPRAAPLRGARGHLPPGLAADPDRGGRAGAAGHSGDRHDPRRGGPAVAGQRAGLPGVAPPARPLAQGLAPAGGVPGEGPPPAPPHVPAREGRRNVVRRLPLLPTCPPRTSA